MDYSTWSLMSSSSLDVAHSNNTLRLFDDAPVKLEAPTPSPPRPSNNTNKIWHKEETGALVEELNRVNAENKRLTEMLTVVCENYNDLKRQLVDYMMMSNNNKTSSSNADENKKRKLTDNNNIIQAGAAAVTGESSSSDEEEDSYGNNNKPNNNNKEETIKAKITRVAVRTEASDSSLILKDGYQWRKYGQKVTRDNPCPRAYFKCSFAPTCPVKKKVQRSLEDQSMLVATYEGEHNHAPPPQQDREGAAAAPTSRSSFSLTAPPAAVTLDLITNNNKVHDADSTTSTTLTKISSPEFQKLLADQMASTLTKDPNFTAALAAAITGRFVHQT